MSSGVSFSLTMYTSTVLDASFYSPCKSGIYGDSARGIRIDSSSLSFSDNYFKVLIEIFELQEWLTTQWKAYFE